MGTRRYSVAGWKVGKQRAPKTTGQSKGVLAFPLTFCKLHAFLIDRWTTPLPPTPRITHKNCLT